MPIASTRPNSVRLLIEKPSAAITAKVPISETGIATIGTIAVRQDCRNTIITRTTRTHGLVDRRPHRVDGLRDELGRVVDDVVLQAFREILGQLLHRGDELVGGRERVRARPLEDQERHGGAFVEVAVGAVVLRAELDPADVGDACDAAVGVGLDDDPLEVVGVVEPALGLDVELEGGIGAGSAAGSGRPMRPARSGARIAATTSPAVRSRAATFSGSSQIRIA